MLKKHFLFALCFLLLLTGFVLQSRVILLFFILFPIILFPVYYAQPIIFSKKTAFLTLLSAFLWIYYLIQHFSPELCILGIFQGVFCFGMLQYQRHWKKLVSDEEEQKTIAKKEMDAFEKKFSTRISSLQHLEKQVTGLLDLFEVSKDFTEFLSFEGIVDILSKRVKPLFPFKMMHLLFLNEKNDSDEKIVRFVIAKTSVIEKTTTPLSAEESNYLRQLKTSKIVIQSNALWIFPLLLDDTFSSFLAVEGEQPDDLAKYEVLSAFLTLQISKIRLYNSVKELAIRDSLTHVFVRRHFLERFSEELKRSIKFSIPLAVLMLDIDHFKRYNDDYGHIAGDATLKQVASIIGQSLRKVDIVGRFGGEEFIIVIPETKKDGALEISERIRSNIARNTFKIYNSETRVTVSIGMALFQPEKTESTEQLDPDKFLNTLIQSADKALYQAKEEGRNQVVLFQHECG